MPLVDVVMLGLALSASSEPAVQPASPGTQHPAPIVTELELIGRQRVAESLIRRELGSGRDLPVTAEALRRDQDRLMRTHLFSNVKAFLKRPLDGPAVLAVEVQEQSELALTGFAIGYSARTGPVGGVSLAHWNLFGAGHQGGFGISTGYGGLPDGELSYMNPWLDDAKTGLGAVLFRRGRFNVPANVQEGHLGGRLFATRPVLGAPTVTPWLVSTGLQVASLSASAPGGGPPVPRYEDGRAVTVSPSANDVAVSGNVGLAFDSRTPLRGDDRFNHPTDGWLGTVMIEPGLINGTSPLLRLTGGASRYLPMPAPWGSDPATLVLAGRVGTVSGTVVPAYKKFAATDGWDDAPTASVTGYERFASPFLVRGSAFYNNADVKAYLMPRAQFSGTSALVATAEYRFRVFGPASGVVFADYGGYWEDRFLAELLHLGYGAGLRMDTPLGILRLDCGLSGYLPPQLHIGIGHKI
jgi:outer membrane protein insertion porin family